MAPLFLVLVLVLVFTLSRLLTPDTADGDPDDTAAPQVHTSASSFTDVTASAGVGFYHLRRLDLIPMGVGVVAFDFNDDGFQDIYVINSDGPNALYRNEGDETFTDVAVDAGVDHPAGRGGGGCASDYDNDGDQDLYVTSYGPSALFRNNGDGTFADVTVSAGVDDFDATYRSTGCAWGDYDRDGHLDFIVVRHFNERDPSFLKTGYDFITAVRSLALYHNNSDGTFTDVTSLLGDTSNPVSGEDDEAFGNVWGAGFQPGWVDFDNDGDLDLYVVNDFGAEIRPNVLWRNDGPTADGSWSFVDASDASNVDVPMNGMGLAVGDYNVDGFLDFFITNIGENVLLISSGDGLVFNDATAGAGVGMDMADPEDRVYWGTVFFDYDNDGDEDLYVASGKGPPDPKTGLKAGPEPNRLFQNMGNGTFKDVSAGSGADDPGIGRGTVYLDFNNDGCLDLYVTNFAQRAKLLRNVCQPGNNWLVIKTVGTTSNRDGIGARITVVAGGTTQIREVASGGSQMSQNMLEAHFGLGSATLADSVTIRWPSGTVQTLTDVAVNQRLTATEPATNKLPN